EEFSDRIGSKLVGYIPKDPLVQSCERDGFSVLEKAPASEIASVYKQLAKDIFNNESRAKAKPLDDDQLRELSKKYSD
ncbi:MAG: nitrogenase iron protein, partial [Methanimicrococcus sp.]|nr:nitrogenase iron protein [Methanimicrococcus sp.]